MPCKAHDIPEGACYCIQCGADVADRTTRLTLEERALAGKGELYVTRDELYQLRMDCRTLVSYDGSVVLFLGRTIIVQD